MSDVEAVEDPCAASFDDSHNGLRIASIFIILVSFDGLSPVYITFANSFRTVYR